uniref:Protein tyrosine phosphatase shp1/cofactor for p97 atpase-mediated vesicle membrane fusion n=1 Tax=Amblyomma triste TaxID=251400 RepID=A0A023GJF2_AMBTT
MADSGEHSDLIAQFCGVTGADSSRAKLCLESSSWNLQLALAAFYEDPDDSMDRSSSREVSPEPPRSPKHVTIAGTDRPPVRSSGRIRGLSDLANDDSANEDEGQAFYAGGSERSGQQVLGPGRKADSKENFVLEVFKAAKRHGAQVLESGSEGGHPSGTTWAFQGTGHRLGDSASGGAGSTDTVATPSTNPRPPVSRVLKMWRDGFSMDEGPLHTYDDPSSREFLQAVCRGEIPRQLLQEADGAEVNLNMEDHRHEQFIAPARAKVAPFVGQGHRLGAVTPTLSRPADGATPPTEHAEAEAKKAINLDDSMPTTNIQIRLSDGTRLVARMNHSHTVGDIRRYIVTARPEYEAATFVLLTTFPHKELADDKVTLKDANLLNAVIVQRLK